MKDYSKLQHLLWRFGFGPRTQSWEKWTSLPPEVWWPKLRDDSKVEVEYFDVADNAVRGLVMGVGQFGEIDRKDLDKAQKLEIKKQSREDMKSLNLLWLEEMTHSKAQLREKVALFWHVHFASLNLNIMYQQQLLHIIRTQALGNFKDLLRDVSKSAAMLAFLNNQQNKKQHPNENFAREVMELFTLGRGHYTETDVKEAARAFTGWGFQLNGDFVFRKNQHDKESKTILSKTGNFDGDEVLDILLSQRQTAHFIAQKAYRFFVNEDKIPADRIKWLGDRFFDHDYDIMRLLEDIARSDWFYAPENRAAKIKSPVELWVGIRRVLPMELHDAKSQLMIQKALGQILFYPPNVAGWPGGKTWIDSSSLMFRLRLPVLVIEQNEIDLNTKDNDDLQMGERNKRKKQRLGADIDWSSIEAQFKDRPLETLVQNLCTYLLCTPPNADLQATIVEAAQDKSDKRAAVMALVMMTPDYQVM